MINSINSINFLSNNFSINSTTDAHLDKDSTRKENSTKYRNSAINELVSVSRHPSTESTSSTSTCSASSTVSRSSSSSRCTGRFLTPDYLIDDELYINNHRIKWIEVKSFYGVGIPHEKTVTDDALKQCEKYVSTFREGAIIFGFGYGEHFQKRLPKGVIALDARSLPTEFTTVKLRDSHGKMCNYDGSRTEEEKPSIRKPSIPIESPSSISNLSAPATNCLLPSSPTAATAAVPVSVPPPIAVPLRGRPTLSWAERTKGNNGTEGTTTTIRKIDAPPEPVVRTKSVGTGIGLCTTKPAICITWENKHCPSYDDEKRFEQLMQKYLVDGKTDRVEAWRYADKIKQKCNMDRKQARNFFTTVHDAVVTKTNRSKDEQTLIHQKARQAGKRCELAVDEKLENFTVQRITEDTQRERNQMGNGNSKDDNKDIKKIKLTEPSSTTVITTPSAEPKLKVEHQVPAVSTPSHFSWAERLKLTPAPTNVLHQSSSPSLTKQISSPGTGTNNTVEPDNPTSKQRRRRRDGKK